MEKWWNWEHVFLETLMLLKSRIDLEVRLVSRLRKSVQLQLGSSRMCDNVCVRHRFSVLCFQEDKRREDWRIPGRWAQGPDGFLWQKLFDEFESENTPTTLFDSISEMVLPVEICVEEPSSRRADEFHVVDFVIDDKG
jgi:hypothetical protein